MQTLPLTAARRETEWRTIKTIARSNNFPDRVISQLKSQTQQKAHKTENYESNMNTNKKWAVFTYHDPTIRKVTNLFKHTDMDIAFRKLTPYTNSPNQNHTHTDTRTQ